jgi:hypothetical protein
VRFVFARCAGRWNKLASVIKVTRSCHYNKFIIFLKILFIFDSSARYYKDQGKNCSEEHTSSNNLTAKPPFSATSSRY